MYVPAHFQPTDADVVEALRGSRAVDLATATEDGLLATLLPTLWDESDASPARAAALSG